MNKFLSIGIMLLLSGCETIHYGIPESKWNALSETQQEKSKQLYKQKEARAAEIKREQAKREAERLEALAKRATENADVIKITFTGGAVRYKSKTYKITQTNTILQHGERSKITLKHSPASPPLPVVDIAYENGTFVFGEEDSTFSRSINMEYRAQWKYGQAYTKTKLPFFGRYKGTLDIIIKTETKKKRDVEKAVDIVNAIKSLL